MKQIDPADGAFLMQRPLVRVAALSAVERGAAQVLARLPGGLLLIDQDCDTHMLCTDQPDIAHQLLRTLPESRCILNECLELDGWIAQHYQLHEHMCTTNVVRHSRATVPVQPRITFAPMEETWLSVVETHYPHHSTAQIKCAMREKRLFGGFWQEQLIGFVGRHPEGSIGMLVVLPEFRRHGFGWELEAQMVNALLASSVQWIYAQIEIGNTASMLLQQKLGFEPAPSPVSWIYRRM